MEIEKILDNDSLIKRFCRDYNVPVSTYNGYWFPKQLSTLSIHDLTYVEKWDEFCKELEEFNSAEDYFEHYNNIKDSVIKYIQNHHEYECFNNMNFHTEYPFSKKELYCEENDNKKFISIDLRKANFNIMNFYCKTLFKGKSWESFLEEFGASHYIQNSKYIRQVIFGACNPKKQIQAQTELMNHIANELDANGYKIYSVVTDEIIIEFTNRASYIQLKDLLKELKILGTSVYKVTKFKLTKNALGYNKEILDSDNAYDLGKVIFKCVDSDFMCQYIKYYYNEEIEERDLVFDYKGKVATFNYPIQNPFK